jgi:hypothetical protein
MNTVNDLDTATGQRERKAYFTLAAQYALAGMELIKATRRYAGKPRTTRADRGSGSPWTAWRRRASIRLG